MAIDRFDDCDAPPHVRDGGVSPGRRPHADSAMLAMLIDPERRAAESRAYRALVERAYREADGAATMLNGRPWMAEDPITRASLHMPRPDLLRPVETAAHITAGTSRNVKPYCWLFFGQVRAIGNLRNFPQPGFGWQGMSETDAKTTAATRSSGGTSTATNRLPQQESLKSRPSTL